VIALRSPPKHIGTGANFHPGTILVLFGLIIR